MTLFVACILFLYCFMLPGFLFAAVFFGAHKTLEGIVAGVSIGIMLVPLVTFAVAMLLHTVVSLPLLITVSTALSAPAAFSLWQRNKARHKGGGA
jgi:uncharacterized membrane protein